MAEYSLGSVVLFGFGTVFVGLILLILVTGLTGFLIGGKKRDGSGKGKEAAAVSGNARETIGDKGAFSAAVAAAVSQCMGTDVSGIRILSIKRVDKGENHDA